MSRTISRVSACAMLTVCSALLMSAAPVFAGQTIAAAKKTTPSNSKKLPTKVTFIDSPSSESPAARKKRLRIECKGRPNAGACLGHTK